MKFVGKINGAILAQILAQALAGWTLLVHLMRFPDVSMIALGSLLAAAIVPFRHNGTHRDRAAGNFGAGLVMAAFLFWEIIFGGLNLFTGNPSNLGLEALFMLVSAVLFSLAGGLFWTLDEEEPV